MMTCTAKELCAATGGALVQDGEGFSCVSTDSRRVEQGCLFIPLVGERHERPHLSDAGAGERRCEACLCSRLPEAAGAGEVLCAGGGYPPGAGTAGGVVSGEIPHPRGADHRLRRKTTTKGMIASVLSQHFLTLKTEANYNNEIGTPQTLLRLMPEHQAAVIETGMDHFGQIRYLGDGASTVAVITNIGDAHIENLGNTRQGTLRAKSEIFEHLQPGGLAVLNGDDALLAGLELPFETILCGRGGELCRPGHGHRHPRRGGASPAP